MEFKKLIYKDQKFYLNNEEYFIFDQEKVKESLSSITFPIILMDTEFFNKSHDPEKITPALYDDNNPDLVYTLSFSIARNYKDLINRNNENAITSYSVKKRFNDKSFDFKKMMNQILTKFFNLAIKQKVKTLVFAGKANDEKFLNNWINQNPAILNNKVSDLFTKNKVDDTIKINIVDIYPVLEAGVSFSGKLDEEKQNHFKKGLIDSENTIQIPSLNWFHQFLQLYPKINSLKEEGNIYQLCIDVLKLYTVKTLSIEEYKKLQNSFRQAVSHCKHDVLKLIYLLYFLYFFAFTSVEDNPFIK